MTEAKNASADTRGCSVSTVISGDASQVKLWSRPHAVPQVQSDEIVSSLWFEGVEVGDMQLVQVSGSDSHSPVIRQCEPGMLLVGILSEGRTRLYRNGAPYEEVPSGRPFFLVGDRDGTAISWDGQVSGVLAFLRYDAVFADMPEPVSDCGSLPPGSPLVPPVISFFKSSLTDNGFAHAGPFASYALEKLATEMVAAIFLEAGGSQALVKPSDSTIFTKALLLITSQASQPELTPDRLAVQLGVSTRTLQREFSKRDSSVATAIRQQRLNVAKKLLVEYEYSALSLAAVARHSGLETIDRLNRSLMTEGLGTAAKYRRKNRKSVASPSQNDGSLHGMSSNSVIEFHGSILHDEKRIFQTHSGTARARNNQRERALA